MIPGRVHKARNGSAPNRNDHFGLVWHGPARRAAVNLPGTAGAPVWSITCQCAKRCLYAPRFTRQSGNRLAAERTTSSFADQAAAGRILDRLGISALNVAPIHGADCHEGRFGAAFKAAWPACDTVIVSDDCRQFQCRPARIIAGSRRNGALSH